MKINVSIISLLIVNIFPIIGVTFFNWDLSSIIFLYWLENIVIGFYTVLKMIRIENKNYIGKSLQKDGQTKEYMLKIPLILFFIVHYGMFTLGHGIFLIFLLTPNLKMSGTILVGLVSLFISHGISYQRNFINKSEFKKKSSILQMFAPYPRVIIMHLTVLFGSYLMISLNLKTFGALLILITSKTAVDLITHIIVHNWDTRNTIPTHRKNMKLIEKLLPGFEKRMAEGYREQVESGEWEIIKNMMEPEEAKKIEEYWLKYYGIDSRNPNKL
jgi:hypothetical protein